MNRFLLFNVLKIRNKYILILTILLLCSKSHSQELFLLRYNGPSICLTSDCVIVQSYYYLSGNTVINPIAEYNNFFVFDKFPTYIELVTMAETGFNCDWRSPPTCGDRISLKPTDCNWVISNKVLTEPTAVTNSFCDKVSLAAVGCTGTQKFYWEYSTDGVNFTRTNAVTGFNQNYEFIKANFPALNNYFGNIFFRVLIDWDPTITDENIYSNIVTYKINSCSPTVNISSPNYTTCNYSNGDVVFTFSRALDSNNNEKLLFSRNIAGSDLFVSSTSLSPDVEKVTDKIYKWKNIPAGTYNFSYQTQLGNNLPSEAVSNLTFTITPKQKLEFEVTISQPACNNNFGQIKIAAKGGNPPYFYYMGDETIDNKHAFTSPYTLPTQFEDGNYKITVIDSKDCIEK